MADSISITVKPEKGLSGTTSLTIHDDGNVTILVYESAVKINENTIDISSNDSHLLRVKTINAISKYMNQDSYKYLKTYSFTTSLAYTIDSVTKNISSKRLNKETVDVIQLLTRLVPEDGLQYVKSEF
jgi:hypothetical protein